MGFAKGNKYGKGGKREGAGAKSKKEIAKKLETDQIIRQKLEEHLEEVVRAYLDNAKGRFETRITEKGETYEQFIIDPPTARHFIDKFLPAARQEIDVNHRHAVVIQMFDGNEQRRKRLTHD